MEDTSNNNVPAVSNDLPMVGNESLDISSSKEQFEFAQRVAKVYAASQIVPQAYRGNLPDCLIAITMANRMGIDAFTFMQNSQVIRGKVGISGQLAISLINTSKRFQTPIDFEYTGEGENLTCTAWTIDVNGERKEEKMSMKEVKAWGWLDKSDSLWPKMPRQMLAYRTSLFFARKYCPEVLCGLRTVDEIKDIEVEVTPRRGALSDLQSKVLAKAKARVVTEAEEEKK